MEGGWGAGMQRAGLVGDQMSSQWGRNVEEGERYRKQSSSQQSPCPVQEHMLINQCSCRCEQCFRFDINIMSVVVFTSQLYHLD